MESVAVPNLFMFWLLMALIVFAVWCVFTALIGLTEEAKKRWEPRAAFWTGRVLLVFAALALLVLSSYGLLRLTTWVLR